MNQQNLVADTAVEDTYIGPRQPVVGYGRIDRRHTADDIASSVRDGDTVVIGGFGTANHPMALVRALIKREVRDLTLVGAATAGLEVDLLVGAGCVKKLIAPFVGGGTFAPIGHCYRRAVERREIELWECSEFQLYGAILAGAANMSFFPWKGGLKTSLPDLNPDLRPMVDPLDPESGAEYLAVPALTADIAILHVARSDRFANGQHLGPYFGDRWLARAADRIVLTAEQIVDNSVIRSQPFLTTLPGSDAVVEARYGSHPYAAGGAYREDAQHIEEYVAATEQFRRGNDKNFKQYLDRYIFEPEDHIAYLERIGIRQLLGLHDPSGISF